MKKWLEINKYFLALVFLFFSLAIFLRFYRLNTITSPYWEEAALGYDSYSLLETGKDHHGNSLPIAAVESFGDYKASFYFYAAIPFIKIFGLNVLAIRLPSALSGLAIVFGTAFLAINLVNFLYSEKKFFKEKRFLFLITLFLTTISPWAINFSRGAWESNLATAFLIWAMNFFFFYQKNTQKTYFLPLASLFFILSSYTYHANKLIAPLVAIFLALFWLIDRFKNKQKFQKNELVNIVATVALAGLMFLPLLMASRTDVGQQRFKETSIFSEIKVIEYSNQKKAEYNNVWWARIYYHRYLLFAKEIAFNLGDHFSFKYLFLSGDGNLRHNSQITGQLYHLDFIFLILAIIYLIKKRKFYSLLIFVYIFIAFLPSALTTNTPHALRTLSAMPMFIVLISIGVWQTLIYFKNPKARRLILIFLLVYYLTEVAIFWRYYSVSHPLKSANSWQDGYEELMTDLAKLNDGKKTIYISREQGRPAMYYWFFNQIDPLSVQGANKTAVKDQGEFLTYQNLVFFNKSTEIKQNGIVAAAPEFIKKLSGKKILLKEIKDKSATTIWQIVDYQL
jgi:hypothetical protein